MSNLEEFKKDVLSVINSEKLDYDNWDGWFIQDNGIRSADEVARNIISFAMGYGFNAPDQDIDSEDYSEILGYIMDDAIEYLSNGVPDGYWIGNDGYAGGFGIWTCEDD